jgi:hypothetical protein
MIVSVAMARNSTNRGSKQSDGKVLKDSLGIDVQGATGEFVVAKAFGLEWDGKIKNYQEWLKWRLVGHDVSGLEVRFTRHRGGSLIVHPKDSDNSVFVLVIPKSFPFEYEIVGWCYGHEGKQKDYWKDVGYGRPCFYVPQKKLKDVKLIAKPMENK